MLSKLRVLEMSSPETMLAGQILGDLGADVILVEPPAGAAGRRLEPFIDDEPGLERSLAWLALNRNKRGITLDLESSDGAALLASLAERSDVLLEAGPGGRAALAFGAEADDWLIRCVIRPFSMMGPKSHYSSDDLILMAASGALGLTGDADRPPLPFPVPQAMMEASGEAVVGVLAALLTRDQTQRGQLLEVSARLAALFCGFGQSIVIPSGNSEPRRSGDAAAAGVQLRSIFECKDGFVAGMVLPLPAFGGLTQSLAAWLRDEGAVSEEVAVVNWTSFPTDLATGKASPAMLGELVQGFTEICKRLTKQELGDASREWGLLVAPVMEMEDIYASRQHEERGLWAEIELLAGRRSARVPARFAHFPDYDIEIRRSPPSLSQHTFEVLRDELSLSPAEIQALFIHGIV